MKEIYYNKLRMLLARQDWMKKTFYFMGPYEMNVLLFLPLLTTATI